MSEPLPRPASWSSLAAPAIAFLLLSLANGWVWEVAHDEGVTFDQAIGHLPLEPGTTVGVGDLYAAVEARTPHAPADVIDALMSPYGMHPPAYYLLINAWTKWVGTEHIALSLPAYLFGILSILAMHRLAGQVLPRAGQSTATWLLACSPWLIGYGNLARPYAIALCIALWATTSLLSARDGRSGSGWRVAFVLLSVAGLYTVYHYAFVLAWQLALGGLLAIHNPHGKRARALVALALEAASIALAFLPWLPRFREHLDKTHAVSWYFSGLVPCAEWPAKTLELTEKFALSDAVWTPAGDLLQLAFHALALATLLCLVLSFSERRRSDPLARHFWWSVPVLPALIIGADLYFEDRTFFISKTTFFSLAILILGIAGAVAHTAPRIRAVLAGGWRVLFVASVASIVATHHARVSDHERIAHYLSGADDESHHLVLNTPAPGYAVPFVLAARAAGLRELRVSYVEPTDLVDAVAQLTSDPGVRRLTLLHFNATYLQEDLWDPSLFAGLRRRARANGWQVEAATPRALGSGAVAKENVAVVVSPVRARNFSD